MNNSTPKYIPLAKWDEFFPDPSVASLRWLIFSNPDFERSCILRRGRRLLVDVEAYESWLLSQNNRSLSSEKDSFGGGEK
jgi:hypothetical protein